LVPPQSQVFDHYVPLHIIDAFRLQVLTVNRSLTTYDY